MSTTTLKRNQKVTVSYRVPEITVSLAEFFGLDKDDPIPEKGSKQWSEAMAYWLGEGLGTIDIEAEAVTTNPAHDPDTVSMFAELEPDPEIRWEIKP